MSVPVPTYYSQAIMSGQGARRGDGRLATRQSQEAKREISIQNLQEPVAVRNPSLKLRHIQLIPQALKTAALRE